MVKCWKKLWVGEHEVLEKIVMPSKVQAQEGVSNIKKGEKMVLKLKLREASSMKARIVRIGMRVSLLLLVIVLA